MAINVNAKMEIFKYNKNITNYSGKDMNIEDYKIRPSKHFIMTWMRKWDCDIESLKSMLENSYKIDKVGKHKYESYTKVKGKSKKLIFIKDDEYKEIFIITGAEGK